MQDPVFAAQLAADIAAYSLPHTSARHATAFSAAAASGADSGGDDDSDDGSHTHSLKRHASVLLFSERPALGACVFGLHGDRHLLEETVPKP